MLDLSKVLEASKAAKGGSSVKSLRLCDISVDENQPRSVIDEQSLLDLASDIEQNGLLQPILVREVSSGKYMIIAGERRYRAFSLLNMQEIPCIVKSIEVDELSNIGYLQMSENLKRDNLRFYEIAEFIQSKVDAKEPKGEVAKRLGISSRDVSSYLAWGKAPDWLKAYKNRFSSAQTFYEYVQFATKQDEDALKEFMSASSEDTFTKRMLKGLQSKTSDTDHEETVVSEVESMDSSTRDADSAELEHEHADDSDAFRDESNESFESAAVDSDEVSEESSEDAEVQFYSADDEHASDENFDDGDINASNDADSEADEFAISDSFTEEDIESSVTHEDHYKKPIILGYVDGREAELLYKTKPQSDGFVWVKYEDGSQAEALAEQFTLNRIIEG